MMSDAVVLRLYRHEDESATVKLWHDCGLLRPWNEPIEDIQLCITSPSSDLILSIRGHQVVGSAMLGHDGHRG